MKWYGYIGRDGETYGSLCEFCVAKLSWSDHELAELSDHDRIKPCQLCGMEEKFNEPLH